VIPLPDGPDPISLTRLEFNEHNFVRRCAGHTDGVVINLRFDTPPKHGGLKRATLAARLPFLIDLETWRLPFLAGSDDDSFGIDAQTAVAKAVPLPLSAFALRAPGRIEGLIRVAATVQAEAALSFAPDFQFSALDDPLLDINVDCIREMCRLVPRARIAVWVHVTLETMLSGILPFVADRYSKELPSGTYLVLTVSDLRPELAPDELGVYFSALRAFKANGFRVLADRASEVSIPAVASFADGCMLGNRIYRTAPPSPIYTNDFNPIIPLSYLDGERARRVPRRVARRRGERNVLGCRFAPADCDAIKADSKRNIELRLHAAHELRESARRARRLGNGGLRSQWRDAKQKPLRGFAQALAFAEARSHEA
jgi:hypothetical protein